MRSPLLLLVPFLALLLSCLLPSVASASNYTVLIGWNTFPDANGPSWYSLYFYPAQLTVAYGDSVTWVWNSGEVHNIVFSNGTTLSETSPDGTSLTAIAGVVGNQTVFSDYAQTYSSGIRNNHVAPVTLRFLPITGSGNFTYYCSIHSMMVGVISVLPAGSTAPLTPAQVNASVATQITQLEVTANTEIAAIQAAAATTGPQVSHVTLADGTTQWTVVAGAMWMQPGFAMYARFMPSYIEVHVNDSINFVSRGFDPHVVYFNASNTFQVIYAKWSPNQTAPVDPSVSAPNPAYPFGPFPSNRGVWPNSAGTLNSGLFFDYSYLPVAVPFPNNYTVKFTGQGQWSYICSIHYDIGMVGGVTVKPQGAALCTDPGNNRTCALLTTGASVLGDPQFVGLLGQSFQVHGLDGGVYNLITDAELQVNARFAFLSGPRPCPGLAHSWTAGSAPQSISCWSHDGSYLSEVALFTATARVLLQAGAAAQGFAAVTLDGAAVGVGQAREGEGGVVVQRHSSHHVTVALSGWTLHVENSDGFVNIAAVEVAAPLTRLTSHGLLGQTWRRVKGHIEGDVDDYLVAEHHVWGRSFVYNRFALEA